MSNDRSRSSFFDFLDYLAKKGLMAKATVVARKAAASKVLGILSEDEAADVVSLDLDDVMRRFQTLEGKKYTPASLSTYRARVRAAVDDFQSYLSNPLGFRPSVQSREVRSKSENKKETTTVSDSGLNNIVERPAHKTFVDPSSTILPIPIRPNLTIFVQGLPYDLNEGEAAKIANVIKAMAVPS